MIYTAVEYSRKFMVCGKYVSAETIKRRCKNNMLPSNHIAKQMGAGRGTWIIEILEK